MIIIGEIYCKEFPDKLESFINKFYSTLPVAFMQVLAKYRRWKEYFKLSLLRSNLDEALDIVIKHPSIEFDHHKLTAVIGKIKNQNILERLLQYYFEYDPRMIIDLQEELTDRIDMGILIKFFKEKDVLFVLDKSLRRHQTQNPGNVIVSMGLNEHLIQIDDYYGLIESIKRCPSIDALVISETLKLSDKRHFHVLAAKLTANSGDFAKALSILIEEDALIETLMILSQSSNIQYAEAILGRYSRIRNAVMFMAVSYVLYDIIRPDILFELSQRSQFQELSLPIFCQILRHKLK
jgi:clathrin heavy chain